MPPARRCLAVLVLLLAAPLGGCLRQIPPAMTLAAALPPPDSRHASVVFVRPTSPCDTSDYSIIVDERGRFVANAAPGSRVAVSLTPGSHVFYAWSDRDLRVEGLEGYNPVAAVRVHVEANSERYVGLIVRERQSSVTRCDRWALVDFYAMKPDRPFWRDLPGWLSTTRPMTADVARGQALLEANPAMLQSNLELGRAKLASIDAFWAEKKQRDAERAAGSL